MVAGMWWFFTLLMVSSYTANLAAFLTTETPDPHFTSLNELINNAEQKGITYGAKLGGSTANFFRDKAETDPVYRKAWKFMHENEDTVMFRDQKDGVNKAAKDKYAFFMESSSIAYEIQRKCNLQQVNGVLDQKGYGIAMKKNSTFRNSISTAILQLQSSGRLDKIRTLWWVQNRGGGQCGDQDSEGDAKPLNPKNVGGVFGVTLAGTALALVCAMMETFSHALKKSVKTKRPLSTVLKEEVKFYFSFRKMVKPVYQGTSLEGSPTSTFQSENKDLSFDLVNKKQTSFDTLDSYTNSNKSRKSKKTLK